MTYNTRHIEMAIPKKTLEDLLACHLYSVSFLNDNEDVEIIFKADHLKCEGDKLPLTLKIKSQKEDGID